MPKRDDWYELISFLGHVDLLILLQNLYSENM
jgi:hypothetical protein